MNAPAQFPAQHIKNSLERWKPQIERALKQFGCQTYDDVFSDVMGARKLLFDNGRAFAVVDICDYAHGRVGHVLVAGGSMRGLRELQDLTSDFFKAIGARKLTMLGRHGFMRRLPALGWKQPMIYMEKEL